MSRYSGALLLSILVLGMGISSVHAEPVDATSGFYPIWESTGYIEKHQSAFIGTMGAHFGVADVAHVGLYPLNFMYRAPNGYAKFSLLRRDRWNLATQVGVFHLMEEASRSFASPMFTSRLDNPDFSMNLIPISLAASWNAADWFTLHQTLTGLIERSNGPLSNDVYLGYFVTGELKTKNRSSFLLHAGQLGFLTRDMSLLGMSYRYRSSWLEFRMGYFYRLRKDSSQGSPLIGVGVAL